MSVLHHLAATPKTRHQGSTLAEYLPPLFIAFVVATGFWNQYGNVVRQQMAQASAKFAEYYYQGWFWPEDTPPVNTPWGAPGNGTQGSEGPTDPSGADGDPAGGTGTTGNEGGGSDYGEGNGGSNDTGTAGNGSGAGGDVPVTCDGGASVSNAATFTSVGNPIDIGTGNKFQAERDYTAPGRDPLQFTRYYNSTLADRDGGIGYGWRHSYQRAIVVDASRQLATVWRDDGTQYGFTAQGDHFAAPLGVIDRLTRTATGWRYVTASSETETYDAQGRLQRVDQMTGSSQILHYGSDGALHTISDSRGRSLRLRWQAGHVRALDLPDRHTVHYGYDDALNLRTVTRSGGWLDRLSTVLQKPERGYHYGDSRHPHALTGLDDATGARYANWAYDRVGRAVLSQHGASAEKITIDYLTPPESDHSLHRVAVTNALGLRTLYTLEPARAGKYRLRDIDGQPAIDCPAVQQHHRYDANGFVAKRWNADHIGATFERNARGLVETEQHGLRFTEDEQPVPEEGSTRIERTWDNNHPRLVSETRSSWQRDDTKSQGRWQAVTQRAYTYDERGRVLSDKLTDLTNQPVPHLTKGEQRTRTYSYEFADAQRTLVSTLAITDGRQNTTIYHYQGERLQSFTNALHQTTEFSQYNSQGQPERTVLPNHLVLQIEYNTKNLPIKLTRTNQADTEITRADYDAAGRLIHLVRPDASEQFYAYNSASQLIQIKNGWGEILELTPNDLYGQWEEEQLRDANGDITQQHRRRFNAVGQLTAVLGNAGQLTELNYDSSGDLVVASERDENPANTAVAHTTQAQYDTQHRLRELIDAAGYSTHYRYSLSGQIEFVSDAKKNTTEYIRNGFGEIVEQGSQATGTVTKRYDNNGNLIENQNPSGESVKFEYDALNRIIKIDYPGEQNDIVYTYDQTDDQHGNGLQQLTKIETQQQTIDYRYDSLGRKIQETTVDKTIAAKKPLSPRERGWGEGALTTTLKYHYLPGNRLDTITYPDGSEVHYRFDKDRITEVTYTDAKTKSEKTIVRAIEYAPFGGLVSWTYGNGLKQTQQRDKDGRITDIALQSNTDKNQLLWSQHYKYDLYQNIEQIQRTDITANQIQQFVYDKLDRLAQESRGSEKKEYSYDALGNRKDTTEDAPTFDYDTAGNIASEQSKNKNRRYRYNTNNKPAAIYDNDQITALYRYNALGWRDEKKTYRNGDLQRTHYTYTTSGKLISEHHDDDQPYTVNYIWLGPLPIAQISNSQIIYLHADHLTAPRVATDDQQKIIWRWDSDAFGNGSVDEDPDHDGQRTTINLRFPGQVADSESGLFYNLNRYYDPQQGRYTQSDPLGQLASMNTYGYVDANPVSWLDPLGLAKLQYVLIDTFGGDPTDASKHTMKDGNDTRMLHFAFYLTDITGADGGTSLMYDPLGVAPQIKDKGWYAWNASNDTGANAIGDLDAGSSPWENLLTFYRKGYGGKNAVNTGDWATINDFNDDTAAELYRSITGNYPPGYKGIEGSCAAPTSNLLPPLPQGFYAMEHFNFPTIVHKVTKPIFKVADLPDVNDPAFNTFPWHNGLTKPAEASNVEAIHPHKPGSTSGVTLGRGFDLSKFTSDKSTILNVLQRVGIKDKLITDAAGLSVSEANSYWASHKTELQNITLTEEQQYLLSLYAFEAKETNIHNVPGASSGVIKLYDDYIKGTSGPEWSELDSKIQDVLFDLNYRGDFHDLSENTTEKSSTPFDDVQFAKSFRDAVQANSVGDLCRVMSDENWRNDPDNPGSPWKVPDDRFEKRRNSLQVGNVCPP